MANEDIKEEIRTAGIRFWEVADRLSIYDSTLSKWLRKEMTRARKDQIRAILNEMLPVGTANAEFINETKEGILHG